MVKMGDYYVVYVALWGLSYVQCFFSLNDGCFVYISVSCI